VVWSCTMKTCHKCGLGEPQVTFQWVRNTGKPAYQRNWCLDCEAARSREQRKTPRGQAEQQRRSAKRKADRAACIGVERFILKDSRKSDRKYGRENNLTKEFIADEISKGCSYCGDSEIRMTLDRIDNDQGHTQDNVVSACIRCNYTRKDMPYKAWLVVARGMREAREVGLFSGWTGRVR